jgi:hypothetical protein
MVKYYIKDSQFQILVTNMMVFFYSLFYVFFFKNHNLISTFTHPTYLLFLIYVFNFFFWKKFWKFFQEIYTKCFRNSEFFFWLKSHFVTEFGMMKSFADDPKAIQKRHFSAFHKKRTFWFFLLWCLLRYMYEWKTEKNPFFEINLPLQSLTIFRQNMSQH